MFPPPLLNKKKKIESKIEKAIEEGKNVEL
jgi:hypothetical protein